MCMGGGGQNPISIQATEIPDWLKDATQKNISMADTIAGMAIRITKTQIQQNDLLQEMNYKQEVLTSLKTCWIHKAIYQPLVKLE